MKKVSFLVLAGALTFILSGCGDGGVAHSLKEVCDNPNTKYDKLEADIIYEMIDIDLTGGKDPIIRKDIRIYDANGDKNIYMTGMPSQKMIYGVKYDGEPGEVIKIKGSRPTCWEHEKDKTVTAGIISSEKK